MPFDSLLHEKHSQLASSIVAGEESAIREALNQYFGHANWPLSELPARAVMKRYPDGREVFAFDNQDLIEFYPLQIKTGERDGKFTVTASRPYRLLTGPKP